MRLTDEQCALLKRVAHRGRTPVNGADMPTQEGLDFANAIDAALARCDEADRMENEIWATFAEIEAIKPMLAEIRRKLGMEAHDG